MSELLTGLGVSTEPQFWVSVLEIIWINVLLSGDNAIVIALACRGLPQNMRFVGMVAGTAVAFLLRVIFTSIVVTLMFIPYLKIVGGAALFWISLKLLAPSNGHSDDNAPAAHDSVVRAVTVIAVADIVMSLDNVIAVAAAAGGKFSLLIFGLGISIPLIVGGATLFMAIMNYFPLIIWAGAAVLGWLSGELIASDPVIADYLKGYGPHAHERVELALSIVGAVGTLAGGWIARERRKPIEARVRR